MDRAGGAGALLAADQSGQKRQEDREAHGPGRDAVRAGSAELRRGRPDRGLRAIARDLHGAALGAGARARVVGSGTGRAARPAAAGRRDVEELVLEPVEVVIGNRTQPRAAPLLHQFLLIPRCAGVGLCQDVFLFLRPTGLADGLALKEMRYAANGDSPHDSRKSGDRFWFPRAPLLNGTSAYLKRRGCYQRIRTTKPVNTRKVRGRRP